MKSSAYESGHLFTQRLTPEALWRTDEQAATLGSKLVVTLTCG